MKYLNLNKEEIHSIKSFSRKKYLVSYLTVLMFISVTSFIVTLFFKSSFGTGRITGSEIIFLLSTGLSVLLAFIFAGRHKYSVWKGTARKKVYRGLISEKKMKEKKGKTKYYLYMEGIKFKVSEKDYFAFKTEEPAEFHVCLNQKILLKVTKPEKDHLIEARSGRG